VASNDQTGRATGHLAVRPDTLTTLADQIGATVLRREQVRAWSMSAVERLRLNDGSAVILKYAAEVFAGEAAVLTHTAAHDVPVPRLLASALQEDGSVVMLMEDLGEPSREADLEDAAATAVAIHACPPMAGRPVLDAAGLAELPVRALEWLTRLRDAGRWLDADDIRLGLEQLAGVADRRARGADLPPFGMCHSEFHPTSVHIGPQGLRVLDWARAYTGSGLLDLVSWQGTPDPLDLGAVSDLIEAYVSAGGPAQARADRGGLPAQVWAGGWDKLWVVEWFLESTLRWADPAMDTAMRKALRVHLGEAVECLT
jgi:hypothetical protein